MLFGKHLHKKDVLDVGDREESHASCKNVLKTMFFRFSFEKRGALFEKSLGKSNVFQTKGREGWHAF